MPVFNPKSQISTNFTNASLPQIGSLKSGNRWLIIEPHELPSCVPTHLRVTVEQPMFEVTKYTKITLKPRISDLVAVLETSAQKVGYTETVKLDASRSYDPDNVQVSE